MIEFKRHPALIALVHPRVEMHGEVRKPFLDIKLTVILPNSFLDALSGTLRPALFGPSDDLLGRDEENLTVVKNPELGALKWDAPPVKGVKAIFHLGSRTRDDLTVADGKLTINRIEPQSGGTFEYTFTVAFETFNNETSKLHMLYRSTVPVTLDAEEAEVMASAEEEQTEAEDA